jgi:predicted O-methyltransferase YrrM
MNLADVLNDPPKPHKDAADQYIVMGLTVDALKFISDNVDRTCATLETGSGLSTIAFALTGARHVAISPADYEFEIIKGYCRERQIPTEQIEFIVGGSERVLPRLELPALDLVLIDGRHGFPAPYIDWFYTAGNLKKGGHVIVDDVWVWSGQVLHDFLDAQPEWQLVADFGSRTSVFKKLDDGSELLEWTQQPFVARTGRLRWIDGQLSLAAAAPPARGSSVVGRALADLGRGDLRALSRKIKRRLGPRS